MTLTNRYGLPGAFVNACTAHDSEYQLSHNEPSDISVTELIGPVQQSFLKRKHAKESSEDVSDRIYALMGTAVHAVLEKAENSALTEKRLYAAYDGWVLSGQFDRMSLSQLTLQDYKLCSVWEGIFGVKFERVAQLNCLLQLATDNGFECKKLEVVAIYRDWMSSRARRGEEGYPKRQVERIEIPVWNEDERLDYIKTRIRLHKESRTGGPVAACDDGERWYTGDIYAVKKRGLKRAVRGGLYPNKKSAENRVEREGTGHYIEFREGENKRCNDYCAVKSFCKQYGSAKNE